MACRSCNFLVIVVAQDTALDDFFHILEWYWTELRTDDGPGDGELLMLEDGSVEDPYVDGDLEDEDSSREPVMNDSSDEPGATLELEAPLPEAPPSDAPHAPPIDQAPPSEPTSDPPSEPPQATPSEPSPENPTRIAEPLPMEDEAPPSTMETPDKSTLSSEKPGEIAQVPPSWRAPAGSTEPAPSTPKQPPKLHKLPQFEIPGPEHERELLRAQMDQQIAALRLGLCRVRTILNPVIMHPC